MAVSFADTIAWVNRGAVRSEASYRFFKAALKLCDTDDEPLILHLAPPDPMKILELHSNPRVLPTSYRLEQIEFIPNPFRELRGKDFLVFGRELHYFQGESRGEVNETRCRYYLGTCSTRQKTHVQRLIKPDTLPVWTQAPGEPGIDRLDRRERWRNTVRAFFDNHTAG